jgi:phage recombination protein Bet
MNEITTQSPAKLSALNLRASKFSVEPTKLLDTLKSTVFKGASNEELLALVVVANNYGLNPLLKEIYAFPAKGGGIVPVVSVDGWIRMCNDHPQMDGAEFTDHHEGGKLVSVTCRIHRKDRSHPTVVTEYLSECKRNTEPWKMENRMLRHKALIQCARVAFGFSGIQDEDEAKDAIANARVATGRVVSELPKLNPYVAAETQIEASDDQSAFDELTGDESEGRDA